ncbi:MAG: Cof-type HAD-IIB family hydrolase [Chlorobi bacterium]|nr:Cof-type HAD-IIB family hydrolase [Chlorobiota bacterium]MCI0714773.1 Cof-type HAD-IIB family hydrolase [Chlorobiota bacterium]
MHRHLKDIKLIVIDIDGTLVDVNGEVGEKSLSLAKELKKQSIYCTLSSARSYYYSSHIADELDIDIPFVTLDGALIKDRKGNTVYKGVINDKIIKKAIKFAENNYGKITMCDEDNMFITPRNAVVKEYTKLSAPVKEVIDFSAVKNILEVLIFCEDKASLRAIRDSFSFFDSLNVSLNVMKSPRNDYYLLTVKNRGSDKLTSVKRLVKYLKLTRKNVAVIGDWHNDMPLFDYGAYNIAVQNAIPELKRKADYVTRSTNNEDAVGEVLELVHNYNLNGSR